MVETTSRDGTSIAYERTGTGPALIVVDAAGNFSDFRPMRAPVSHLAERFTVYVYDRRGRGASTDTVPYAVEREVEDLAALIDEAGGSAYVYGMSSGGLLAIHSAARGLPIRRMALFEPPLQLREDPSGFTTDLSALVEAGRRRDAVDLFHRSIGVPEEMLPELPMEALESVAHTLVYDCTLSDTMTRAVLERVAVPTLILDSAGSGDELTGMAATAAAAIPHAVRRSLPGGWHGVTDDVLAPVLAGFLLDGQ